MSWTVNYHRAALEDFDKLAKAQKAEVLALVEELEEEGPAIHGAIELRSNPDNWRVRFDDGKSRMVYRVSKGKRRIIINRLKPRGVVYKGLRG